MDIQKIVSDLKHERDRLTRAIEALEGGARSSGARITKTGAGGRRKKRKFSPEARKRLSMLMKQRWAERKKKSASR